MEHCWNLGNFSLISLVSNCYYSNSNSNRTNLAFQEDLQPCPELVQGATIAPREPNCRLSLLVPMEPITTSTDCQLKVSVKTAPKVIVSLFFSPSPPLYLLLPILLLLLLSLSLPLYISLHLSPYIYLSPSTLPTS